jgi:hypothetical protein
MRALEDLGLPPDAVWSVGDNLEWDVSAPQKPGILGIWHDVRAQGLPPASPVIPDRVITSISALMPCSSGIFVAGNDTVPFAPAVNRVCVRFRDSGGTTREATSVAGRTPCDEVTTACGASDRSGMAVVGGVPPRRRDPERRPGVSRGAPATTPLMGPHACVPVPDSLVCMLPS